MNQVNSQDTPLNEQNSSAKKIGIVAGWGSFPVEIARHYREKGYEVYTVAIKEHAAPELAELSTDCRWTGVLKFGAAIRYLRSCGVSEVAFAGKIFKDRILYHGRGWIAHMPDLTCLRIISASFITRSKDGRDDTLLSGIVAEYERRGIKVLPITHLASHLLATEGCLTKRSLSKSQEKDVRFGWQIARQMGGLDIGQSITVKDQIVLGVEAIEGTDALISRTANICPRGGFTLVKVAKPNQDMRFDVPTIGPQTIQRLAAAGATALAVEATKTIIVELEKTVQLANKLGIRIVVMPSETCLAVEDSSDASNATSPSSLIVATGQGQQTQARAAQSKAA